MLVDVLAYETPAGETSYRACDAGEGAAIVAAHRREVRTQRVRRWAILLLLGVPLAVYGIVVIREPFLTVLGFASLLTVALVARSQQESDGDPVPELVAESIRLAVAEQRYDLDVTPE